jgi:hypothetical protein
MENMLKYDFMKYYVKKKTLNINKASIFITLTEIKNETHYVAKNIKKKYCKLNKHRPKISVYHIFLYINIT